MKDVINHTSVDDIRSSLYYFNNPSTLKDLNRDLAFLKRSLEDENTVHLKRPTVIKMLEAKIRKLEKMRKQFLNG